MNNNTFQYSFYHQNRRYVVQIMSDNGTNPVPIVDSLRIAGNLIPLELNGDGNRQQLNARGPVPNQVNQVAVPMMNVPNQLNAQVPVPNAPNQVNQVAVPMNRVPQQQVRMNVPNQGAVPNAIPLNQAMQIATRRNVDLTNNQNVDSIRQHAAVGLFVSYVLRNTNRNLPVPVVGGGGMLCHRCQLRFPDSVIKKRHTRIYHNIRI